MCSLPGRLGLVPPRRADAARVRVQVSPRGLHCEIHGSRDQKYHSSPSIKAARVRLMWRGMAPGSGGITGRGAGGRTGATGATGASHLLRGHRLVYISQDCPNISTLILFPTALKINDCLFSIMRPEAWTWQFGAGRSPAPEASRGVLVRGPRGTRRSWPTCG